MGEFWSGYNPPHAFKSSSLQPAVVPKPFHVCRYAIGRGTAAHVRADSSVRDEKLRGLKSLEAVGNGGEVFSEE